MSNIAIVMGISIYDYAEDLPACKNDADSVEQLLQATGKYHILRLDQELIKPYLIDQIDNFIKSVDDQIDEILFYFSGHGCQDDTGLHYILKNTEMEKINTTSFNNNELDDLVREYNPQLFVKIIDACQSGFHYIKSVDFEENLDEGSILQIKSNKAFENCIFMSSSRSDQSSIATDECSLFTKAFISSVLDGTSSDVVRYSDIQNYLTDVFKTNKYAQIPYFTLQCDGRAVFTYITEQLKKLADTWLKTSAEIQDIKEEMEVKLDKFLNAYRVEEEVKDIVDKIMAVLKQENLQLSWMNKYYDIDLENKPKYDFKEDTDIVNFLYERAEKENLYIEFETERVKKESALGIPLFGYETIPVRFSILAQSLPSSIRMDLLPKNEGLPRYEIELVFIYCDTGMYIFQGAKQFVFKGWNQYVLRDKKKYSYKRLEYAKFEEKDWRDFIHNQLEDSAKFVEESLDSFISRVS